MRKHERAIKVFGHVLHEFREEKGLTQQDLADKSALDIRTIQRIEKGEMGTGLHLVFAIAEALEIAPADLFIRVSRKMLD